MCAFSKVGDPFMTNRQTHADHASQILVLVTQRILEKVIKASEAAVLEVTEKLQGMSNLTEQQKEQLSGALVSFYHSDEGDEIKQTLNDNATAMMEAAQRGDMAEVERLSQTEGYDHARKATKKLHDTLQHFTTDDAALNDYIMPVLVALQFQDSLRQELEGVLKCVEQYFSEYRAQDVVAPAKEPVDVAFWQQASRNFTNIEAREIVLEVALGAEGKRNEVDVRTAKAS
jgi:hypothetical protein